MKINLHDLRWFPFFGVFTNLYVCHHWPHLGETDNLKYYLYTFYHAFCGLLVGDFTVQFALWVLS